jgi:CobQ-like glutamine amidotransferase family enzyme
MKPTQKRSISILHLYPREMNLYGDHGNVLTIQKRCEWRGIDCQILTYEPGDDPKVIQQADIIFGGGGQDSGQALIEDDLRAIGPVIAKQVEGGAPTLVVCGLYQLFGKFFQTVDDDHIDGIGVFDIETYGGTERLIGNIIEQSDRFGEIVGYENHSGQTKLCSSALKPLGLVTLGAGNDADSKQEGVIYKNAIGTYLHGPILPNNPAIADFLIYTALHRKYPSQNTILDPLDDSIADLARTVHISRPR